MRLRVGQQFRNKTEKKFCCCPIGLWGSSFSASETEMGCKLKMKLRPLSLAIANKVLIQVALLHNFVF